ncbi:hypothetical protein ACRALDRAFT_2016712 [Sodiomyces alcalophilus JCM 7366]|uniref:uncharacterized protein n=1 Tax=Sodiomyces alcalophilus JCM 7366 TaxID=591952 RepID=UPI0039B43282
MTVPLAGHPGITITLFLSSPCRLHFPGNHECSRQARSGGEMTMMQAVCNTRCTHILPDELTYPWYYNHAHQIVPPNRVHYPKLSQQHPHSDDGVSFLNFGHLQRKMLPLPFTKRLRTSDHEGTMGQTHQNPYTSHHNPDHDDHISRTRNQTRSPPSTRWPDPTLTRPPTSRVNSGALLEPCHICRRKPTKKSDLDSYADCEGSDYLEPRIRIRQIKMLCPGLFTWTMSMTYLRGNKRREEKEEETMVKMRNKRIGGLLATIDRSSAADVALRKAGKEILPALAAFRAHEYGGDLEGKDYICSTSLRHAQQQMPGSTGSAAHVYLMTKEEL